MFEIIEDYKSSATSAEKNYILNFFYSSIWNCKNERRIYTKTIKFSVRKDLLVTEVGEIFDAWSEITYTSYKSTSSDTDCISLIRQKINNLYTRLFDERVILNSEYMNLLKTPRQLYYQWLNGKEFNKDYLITVIDNAISDSIVIKKKYQKQKMKLSWGDYKLLIQDIFIRIFNNCKLIEEYEDEKLNLNIDYWNEDNFYIKYFCTYLENELKQYQKKYYNVRQHKKYSRCKECEGLFEKSSNRKVLCNTCSEVNRKKRYIKYNIKRNNHN